jgi:hypothetical protein
MRQSTRQEKKEKGKSGEGKTHGKKNRRQGQPQQKDSQKTGKEKRLEEKAAASHRGFPRSGSGSTDFDETSPSERCTYEAADSDFLARRFNGFTAIQRI